MKNLLPHSMRDQLNEETQSRACFLLAMLSDELSVQQLWADLREKYSVPYSSTLSINQALVLAARLKESVCDHASPFKYRLPTLLGEYPVHTQVINSRISQFNSLIEVYHADPENNALDPAALTRAWQEILAAIEKHHVGCSVHSLWQLLRAMTGWSADPVEAFLSTYPCLLSCDAQSDQPVPFESPSFPDEPVDIIYPQAFNKKTKMPPFTPGFGYTINETGLIEQSHYLLLNGFALKPGGHADALAKKKPECLPWVQWQSIIRRQLSQLIDKPLDDDFFDWLQTVLQRLGIRFLALQSSSPQCYVSPFIDQKTALSSLKEDSIMDILREQCDQTGIVIEEACLPGISRYLAGFLQGFQFNRGQALGIGANWGGVINDSNESGAEAFRFNDSEWGLHFKHLSLHRQGPSEARMNAAIGIKYEFEALLTSFEYMTRLQPSEYADTIYNALVDNLMTGLFPEPPYFENVAYTRHRRQYVLNRTNDGMPHITSFYQPDPEGIYFKSRQGVYKQTPMFRRAGSLAVEPFPREGGSGECFQSLFAANPLWPLQLQYAQAFSNSIRGHMVYNPTGPDEFIPDAFYGQVVRDNADVFVPFIGVVPKNFDRHFNQIELCASFVVRMLQSSRLMVYCPVFAAYYSAILSRFLPPADSIAPALPDCVNSAIKRKWHVLNNALNNADRTAMLCHKAYFSLFKELIFSLYSLTKDDASLHYYFFNLVTSEEAFEPRSRSTCERLIRELTALRPFAENIQQVRQYDTILDYLKGLNRFFWPVPHDKNAQAIADQARLHAGLLITLPEIKSYFADMKLQHQANLSPKVSPGLMHDALKYQGPSKNVRRDFYDRRHRINFPSGFRDLDGSQMARPSAREVLLDKVIKTGGALLPIIYRDKTLFSLITKPLSEAYIRGHQTYLSEEGHRKLSALAAALGGFVGGVGLGLTHALKSIPMMAWHALPASTESEYTAVHDLAISSAPGNEPGLHVEAMMAVRDQLLQFILSGDDYIQSIEKLTSLTLCYFKKLHPFFLSHQITSSEDYIEILLALFPLQLAEWQQLSEPVIRIQKNKSLQDKLNQHALQIDGVFINALYDCLTTLGSRQPPKKIIREICEKHKLKNPQDKLLNEMVNYYTAHHDVMEIDIGQYRFNGTAMMQLKSREKNLGKIQEWLNNALNIQWVMEVYFECFMDQYQSCLNQETLSLIISKLPDSIKQILHELVYHPDNGLEIVEGYQLNESQKKFLLQCLACYKTIPQGENQDSILQQTGLYESASSTVSIKAREHSKLIRFIQREWNHEILAIDAVLPIAEDIKKQIGLSWHTAVDELVGLYQAGLERPEDPAAFDEYYMQALKLTTQCTVESPLREWVNVTMNALTNKLLDKATWEEGARQDNPLNASEAVMQWLNYLMSCRQEIRPLLVQQIEQTPSFDHAAWRCQYILQALEVSQPELKRIRGTGMQKLMRIIAQNRDTLTAAHEHKAKKVPLSVLCGNSFTMWHATKRIKEKVPYSDFVRVIEAKI